MKQIDEKSRVSKSRRWKRFALGLLIGLAGPSSAMAVDIDVTGGDATLSTTVSGSDPVNIIGPGKLTLSGVNTHTGGTILNSSTVGVTNAASLGTGALTTNGISGISKETTDDLSLANDTNWNGLVFVEGQTDGTFTLTGEVTLQTATILNYQRDLVITSAINATDPATVFTLGSASGALLTLQGGSNRTAQTDWFGANVLFGDAGALGTGLINMNGDNTLSVASAMTIGNAITMGDSLTFGTSLTDVATLSGPITLSAFSNELSGRANLTSNIGGASGQESWLVFADDANFTLAGNNTFTGGTQWGDNVNLTVGHNNALGTGAMTLLGGDSTLSSSVADLNLANDIELGNPKVVYAAGTAPGLTIFDALDLTLSGDISGAGSLTLNGSTVTLTGTNTHTGGTVLQNGIYRVSSDAALGQLTNQVDLDQAILIFTESTESFRLFELSGDSSLQAAEGATVKFNGLVRNEGIVTMNGPGGIEFAGGAAFGALNVNSGTLSVNDTLAIGPTGMTVGAGGALGGAGTITGNIINNGRLAVGNSIGDLSQTGNYTQTGGTVEVEINDGGNVAGTNNDVLRVDGNIAINGATLDVIAAPGTYTDGTQFTIFTSTGTIGGTGFTGITDNLADFDFETIFGAGSILLQINASGTDFTAAGGTFNTINAGTFVDDHFAALSPDLRTAMSNLNNGATVAGQQQGLAQFGGSIYASAVTLGVQQTGLAVQTLTNQLGSLDSLAPACGGTGQSHWVGWVSGFGVGGSTQFDGNNAGLDYSYGGTSFGFGKSIAGAGTFGFFGNVAATELSDAGSTQRIEQDTMLLGGFGRLCGGGTYLTLAAAGGFDDLNATRTINGLASTMRGSGDGGRALVLLENGFDFGDANLMLQPYYGLQYIHGGLAALGESGAAALQIGDIHHNSLRTRLGIRVGESNLNLGSFGMGWSVHTAWMHELADRSTDLSASVDGVNGSLAQTGFRTGRDFALVGTQMHLQWSDSLRLVGNYDLQAGGNQVLHLGGGGVEYAW